MDESSASKSAKALSDLGASKGGKARKASLSPEERSDIARTAVLARWQKAGKPALAQARYGSPDRPLRIDKLEIPCYVLEDKRRVLVQRGLFTALDMSQGTAGKAGADRLASFVASKSIKPYVDKKLHDMIMHPIRFRTPNGSEAYGYEATILADICDAVLEARHGGKMNYQIEHIAHQCEILVRGFARVGIVALVDEATGYQEERERDALAKILEAFVAKELRPWIHTFPADYYKEMYRLRGLAYPPSKPNKMPQYFGKLTNDIVYSRLAPGVLEELRRLTPRNAKGRLKQHLHRRLTETVGHPKLLQHLGAVVALMKVSTDKDWDGFTKLLNRLYPRHYSAPLFDDVTEQAAIVEAVVVPRLGEGEGQSAAVA